jgi:large subunit ribosomal protein L10
MALYTHHLPAWKKDEVAEIKKNAKEYKLIGLVDMYGIPAQQVQQIRRNLRGKAVIKVTRNTLITHAFNDIGGDVKNLTKFISGHSAIIFTNDNPFKLFKQLEKTKTKMAAKAGEKAPEDIVIPGGPTSFKPGRLSVNCSRQVSRQPLKAARSRSRRPRRSSRLAASSRQNSPRCSPSSISSPWT